MSDKKLSRRDMLKLMTGAAAGAALSACGAVPTTPTTTPAPTHTAEVQMPTGEELEGYTPKMAPPPEAITLTYWWGNNYEPALEFTHDIIQRFSLAYTDVEVEPVAGQNCEAFVTAAAAGTPPDLFHTWDCVERMGAWAKRGIILPLDNYIAGSDFDMDDYFPGLMETCKMEGETWGMVDGAGLFLLWTRPQRFTEIGHEPDELPEDTDELWEWARDLTTRNEDGEIQRLGMIMPNWLWQYLTWMANFGGTLWDVQAGEPTPEDPGVMMALTDLLEQVEYFGVEALDSWAASIGSQSGAESPWMAGNATMQVSGDWTGQSIFDFFPDWTAGEEYGVAAPPPAPASKTEGESKVVWWTWPWVVPSGIDHPDWSWELLRFMLSPEYQLNVRSKFKELPVRKSLIDDERIWWPAADTARDIIDSGRALTSVMPMNPVASEYLNLMGEAVDNVLHLTETPEEAMSRVKTEVMDALAE